MRCPSWRTVTLVDLPRPRILIIKCNIFALYLSFRFRLLGSKGTRSEYWWRKCTLHAFEPRSSTSNNIRHIVYDGTISTMSLIIEVDTLPLDWIEPENGSRLQNSSIGSL